MLYASKNNNQVEVRIVIKLILAFLIFTGCSPTESTNIKYKSSSLIITALTPTVYVHTTYLEIPNYGKFACNGMIFQNGDEAIIFDTPSSDTVSLELIEWVESELNSKVKAVVINHFHNDCMGGLKAFHDHDIASYANNSTLKLVQQKGGAQIQNGFDGSLIINLGNKKVVNEFLGEAHSKDNIVSYVMDEKVLFGGCMVKSVGAKKGNLEDANTTEWPKTVANIKAKYDDLQWVIPGHGDPGGTELLDYTIELFKE